MHIKDELALYKKEVDHDIKKLFFYLHKEVSKIDPFLGQVAGTARSFTMRGGKRIRAALMYYSYIAFGGKEKKEMIKASASIELIQSFLLMHDDIIDRDDIRRGGPTAHIYYTLLSKQDYPKNPLTHEHFGSSMSMLTGDILYSVAGQVIANSKFKPILRLRAMRRMNQMVHKVVYGEMLDVLSSIRKDFTEKDLLKIHEYKTSSYTFEGPIHLGAILAGAEKKDLIKLSKYAIPLGIAFQLQDDILGMFGDEKKLGKPVGSDLKEGKKTLLIIKALEKATKSQKKIINSALGNGKANKKQIDAVRKIIIDTGSLDYSKALAKKMITKSKKALSSLKLKEEGRSFMERLAAYMLEREY